MSAAPLVIKIGGNDLDRPGFIPALARVIAGINPSRPCILVHGGGRAINALLERLGIAPVFVNGLRVTDEPTLQVVEMVLSGSVNKQITLALLDAGVEALGLSGVDRGLLRAEPLSDALGLAGRIVSVRRDVLVDLCAQGIVPVISPISAGAECRYNVNADHAAGKIAGVVSAERVIFLTNVPGVRVGAEVLPRLSALEVGRLIAERTINGGMIPKVESALAALESGAREAVITDLDGLREGRGTALVL